MKVVVDARLLGKGGIGTYLENILPFLEQWCGVSFFESHAPLYSFKEQADFFLKIPPCDLFWSPHFNAPLFPSRAKHQVVTIHDVFHLDYLQAPFVKQFLRRVTKKGDQLITVSQFSKERILAYFPDVAKKLSVITSGADHFLNVTPKEIKNTPKGFFLFVGSPKPHKNLHLLLEANIPLVIVGEGYEQIWRKNLHYVGKVDQEELCWLYLHAEALLVPSHYEGWGLPALEAMSLGCPVIASRSGSLPEACSDAALFFDADSVQELLQRLSEDRSMLINKGKKRVERFVWEECAKAHFAVFEKALGKSLATF